MLQIVRNRTWAFDLTIFDTYVKDGDPGNVPTNHTGWTIRSQIRTRVGNKLVANLNVTFPVPTAGTVAIRHEREFTRSLATGDYWWDIVATDPAGDDHVYVEPEPIAVRDHPTDPANSTYDFVPGGGGAVMHTHVISDVTGLQAALNNKAPLTHTHSVSDVTGLQTILDGKAPLAHTHTIADVLGLQTILNDLSEGGGGGSTTYSGLTDAATVDLPVINGPLASALAGKEAAGAAATAQAFAIQRANHTGTQAQSTIVNLVSDLAGKASLAGNNTFTAQQAFTDATTWSYTSAAASAHRIALGAGTTGAELFGAATAAAALTTLGGGTAATGTGAVVRSSSPTITTPTISRASTGQVFLAQDNNGASINFTTDSFGRGFFNVNGRSGAGAYSGAYVLMTGLEESWVTLNVTANTSGQRVMRFGNLSNRFSIQRLNDAINIITSTPFSFANNAPTNSFYMDSSGNTGFGTSSPTAFLDVNSNTVRLRTARTPASATAAGNAGDICWDADYIYVCTATNTWKRTAISTWP